MKRLFNRIVLLLDGVALVLAGVALVDFLLHPLVGDYDFHSPLYRAIVILALTPLTLLVGFLIRRRVPGNIVGPLLIVWSGSITFRSLRMGAGPLAFAIFSYFDLLGWAALFLMFLHFPDGNIYPPGASTWIYWYAGVIVFFVTALFLSWGTFPGAKELANPFSIPFLVEQADLILLLCVLLMSPLLIAAMLSPLLRYWKGSLLERQQIKLLVLFAGLLVVYSLLGLIAYPLLTGGEVMDPGDDLVGMIFYTVAGLMPPLAIGVAVLRHHLWDIDFIIRRTLVYSILMVSLSLVYLSSLIVLQSLFTKLIGQQSPAAIVLSTLAMVVLFAPFRRRIQTFIDRRFYRRKYNAEQVLAAFSASVRDEVDLNHLTSSVLEVIEDTMQPEHVSLMMRKVD